MVSCFTPYIGMVEPSLTWYCSIAGHILWGCFMCKAVVTLYYGCGVDFSMHGVWIMTGLLFSIQSHLSGVQSIMVEVLCSVSCSVSSLVHLGFSRPIHLPTGEMICSVTVFWLIGWKQVWCFKQNMQVDDFQGRPTRKSTSINWEICVSSWQLLLNSERFQNLIRAAVWENKQKLFSIWSGFKPLWWLKRKAVKSTQLQWGTIDDWDACWNKRAALFPWYCIWYQSVWCSGERDGTKPCSHGSTQAGGQSRGRRLVQQHHASDHAATWLRMCCHGNRPPLTHWWAALSISVVATERMY